MSRGGEGVDSGARQARTADPALAASRPGIEPGASWSHEAPIRLRRCARKARKGVGLSRAHLPDDPPLARGLLPRLPGGTTRRWRVEPPAQIMHICCHCGLWGVRDARSAACCAHPAACCAPEATAPCSVTSLSSSIRMSSDPDSSRTPAHNLELGLDPRLSRSTPP